MFPKTNIPTPLRGKICNDWQIYDTHKKATDANCPIYGPVREGQTNNLLFFLFSN